METVQTWRTTMGSISPDVERRLVQVRKDVNGDPKKIRQAIEQTLYGIPDRARRVYLRNELTRLMGKEMGDQKPCEQSVNHGMSTPARILEAWRSEQKLLKGIPDCDR